MVISATNQKIINCTPESPLFILSPMSAMQSKRSPCLLFCTMTLIQSGNKTDIFELTICLPPLTNLSTVSKAVHFHRTLIVVIVQCLFGQGLLKWWDKQPLQFLVCANQFSTEFNKRPTVSMNSVKLPFKAICKEIIESWAWFPA